MMSSRQRNSRSCRIFVRWVGLFTLSAVYDFAAGHNAFAYAGNTIRPVIRVSPEGVISLRYVNNLPSKSNEERATAACMKMSNLHFHGLHFRQTVYRMMCSP